MKRQKIFFDRSINKSIVSIVENNYEIIIIITINHNRIDIDFFHFFMFDPIVLFNSLDNTQCIHLFCFVALESFLSLSPFKGKICFEKRQKWKVKTIRFSVNTQWQSKKNEKSIFKMMIIIFARNLNEIDRLICLLFFIKYIQFQTSKKQKAKNNDKSK